MSKIHFIGGEKGGVGKSVTSRLLAQWLIDKSVPFAALDADPVHRTLSRFYGHYTQVVDLEHFTSADEIMNRAMAGERQVIVDLPAQSLKQLQLWFESADLARFASEMEIGIAMWHVTDGGYDSVSDLSRLVGTFQSQFEYVVVKNQGRAADFSQFELTEAAESVVARGGRIIELPALDAATMFRIDQLGASFWAAANVQEGEGALSPVGRQRVRAWLSRCYGQLDAAFAG